MTNRVIPGTYQHDQVPDLDKTIHRSPLFKLSVHMRGYHKLKAYNNKEPWHGSSGYIISTNGDIVIRNKHVFCSKELVPARKYTLSESKTLGYYDETDTRPYTVNSQIGLHLNYSNYSQYYNDWWKTLWVTGYSLNDMFDVEKVYISGVGKIDSLDSEQFKSFIDNNIVDINDQHFLKMDNILAFKPDMGLYQISNDYTSMPHIGRWTSWNTTTKYKNPLFYISNRKKLFFYKHLCLGRAYFRLMSGKITFNSILGNITIESLDQDTPTQIYPHTPYTENTLPRFNNNTIINTDVRKLFPDDSGEIPLIEASARNDVTKAPSKYHGRRFINVFTPKSEVHVNYYTSEPKTWNKNDIGDSFIMDPTNDILDVSVKIEHDWVRKNNTTAEYPFEDCEFVYKPRLGNKATFENPTTYPLVLGSFVPDEWGYYGTMHESANDGILIANMPSNYIDDRTFNYYKMIERPWITDSADLKSKGELAHYYMYDAVVWCGEKIDINVMGNTFTLHPGEVIYDSSCYPTICHTGNQYMPNDSGMGYTSYTGNTAEIQNEAYGCRLRGFRLTYINNDYFNTNKVRYYFNPIIPINDGKIINGQIYGDVLYYDWATEKYHFIKQGVILDKHNSRYNLHRDTYLIMDKTNKLHPPIENITEGIRKQLSRHHIPLCSNNRDGTLINYDASQNRIWLKHDNYTKIIDHEVRYLFTTNVDRIEFTTDVYPFVFKDNGSVDLIANGMFTIYTLNKRLTFKVVSVSDKINVNIPMSIDNLMTNSNIRIVPYTEYGDRSKGVTTQITFMDRVLEYLPNVLPTATILKEAEPNTTLPD